MEAKALSKCPHCGGMTELKDRNLSFETFKQTCDYCDQKFEHSAVWDADKKPLAMISVLWIMDEKIIMEYRSRSHGFHEYSESTIVYGYNPW